MWLGLSACQNMPSSISGVFRKQPKAGPSQVDNLLTQIEHVHVECELSKQRVLEAQQMLAAISAPNFSGDPLVAYERFEKAIEASEDQAKSLRGKVAPMRRAAVGFFEQWAADLSSFGNPAMRQHSQQRLDQTRERYERIVAAVLPAQSALDAFNMSLKDCALFLGNDFNAGSVAAIGNEVEAIMGLGGELEGRLGASLAAAEKYIRAAALRGQIEASPR
jgi:hypothetical protein